MASYFDRNENEGPERWSAHLKLGHILVADQGLHSKLMTIHLLSRHWEYIFSPEEPYTQVWEITRKTSDYDPVW